MSAPTTQRIRVGQRVRVQQVAGYPEISGKHGIVRALTGYKAAWVEIVDPPSTLAALSSRSTRPNQMCLAYTEITREASDAR